MRRVKPHEAPEGARVVPVVQLRQVALLVQEVQEVLAVLVVRVTRARGRSSPVEWCNRFVILQGCGG